MSSGGTQGLCTNTHLRSGVQCPSAPCSYLSIQQNGAIELGANIQMVAKLTEMLTNSHVKGQVSTNFLTDVCFV